MNRKSRILRPIAMALVAAHLGWVALIPASQAGMLSAEQVIETQASKQTSDRQRIADELSRAEVQSLLVEHGVIIELRLKKKTFDGGAVAELLMAGSSMMQDEEIACI